MIEDREIKRYNIPEELKEEFSYFIVLKELLNENIHKMTVRKAKRLSREVAVVRFKTWEKVYKLYPELREAELSFSISVGEIRVVQDE